MKDLSTVKYYPIVEELGDILCKKTQSEDPLFFRIMVSYYLAKIASMMRCNIKTEDRGDIPVSLYAINLAPSGHGKGHSTNIVEEQVIKEFRDIFVNNTFEEVAEMNVAKLATARAIKKGTDIEEEEKETIKEFENAGNTPFSFDSGTTPALKQVRHKLMMAGIGSLNMEIDEIGSNLLGQTEILTTFLELFDVGKVKEKLIKNTSDNKRNEEIHGRTPTNMMLFGTPAKLLNGSKIEEEFMSFLDIGYARRCLFGFSTDSHIKTKMTPEEIYDMLTDKTLSGYIKNLSHKLAQLANSMYFETSLMLTKPVALEIIKYQVWCREQAEQYKEHEEILKAEMTHRYFKALKLAGAYAFVDGSAEVTEDHFYSAVKLVEDSGIAFKKILKRDPNYIKLAKFIASMEKEMTHADISEALAFYKGAERARSDMLDLAIGWGYTNNVIITKTITDGIEFVKGESLKATDLNKIVLAHSKNITTDYANREGPFTNLHKLTQANGLHWVTHHLLEGYRREDSCIPGFNLAVIDVDGGVNIDTVKLLLKDYHYLLYTTKRHTAETNRFRIIFPMSHVLKLSAKDYKEFMNNLYDWLPFEVDTQTNQRSRKWLAHKGKYEYNTGMLLDVLPFIPKTKKAEEQKKLITNLSNLSNLERWFAKESEVGNRSNVLIRYGLMLVDAGLNIDDIRNKLLSFNNNLPDKLDETEIYSTILVSISRAIHNRDTSL